MFSSSMTLNRYLTTRKMWWRSKCSSFFLSKKSKILQRDVMSWLERCGTQVCYPERLKCLFWTWKLLKNIYWKKLLPEHTSFKLLEEGTTENYEGVHLTLPPHIFSIQVKPGPCYITGQQGWVQNKMKET